jgi:magnesium transporter
MAQYKKITDNIQQLTITGAGGQKIKWLNIVNPGKEELAFLRKIKIYDFDFRQLRASSAKVSAQHPLIEQREKYNFLILHFPLARNGEIVPVEIDFFISHGLLVTLHNNQSSALNNFFNTAKKDDSVLLAKKSTSSSVLLYEALSHLIAGCLELIDENNSRMNNVEKIIFSGEQKEAATDILELRRNVIAIRRIMINHKNILKKIMATKSKIIPQAQIKRYYSDLIEQVKRIWEFSENQKESIEALNDTNEAMLNNKINNIMKTLTIFSVIVFPLTLFAAVFGMNTVDGMPFLNNPNGFWIVLSLMGVACVGMLIFFSRKKWL